jgi:hypothetical protein
MAAGDAREVEVMISNLAKALFSNLAAESWLGIKWR